MDMNTVSMADEYPSDPDQDVLAVLRREGRANPKLVRDETGMDKGDVNTVLVRAARHGDVQQVTRGLYEYTGADAPVTLDADEARELADILGDCHEVIEAEYGRGHNDAEFWARRLREAVDDA